MIHMTEHPNYKYRPRRRKHNKQRATSAQGARVGTSLPSPSLPNMSPRYNPGYIPNSPSVASQGGFTTMDFPSPGGSSEFSQQDKRYSPDSYNKYSPYNNYLAYQPNYVQKSPYSIHTPDESPTQSPEPKGNLKGPNSPQDTKDNVQEKTALPTPELSPLDHDKDQYQYDDKQRVSSIQHTNNVTANMTTTNMSPAQQSYNTRVQNYRPNNTNYTNTQPITSVPMANGMYVMCANKSSVEQGHVVTGTFYPPVATSQDQQLLGTTQNNLSTVTSPNMSYYNTSMPQYYSTPYEHPEQTSSKTDQYLQYHNSPNLMHSFKTPMEEQYSDYTDNTLVQTYIPQPEERSDADSEVDTREFDKYLKFASNDTSAIDSNHNYHNRNDPGLNYNFQAQHTSVILPNSNVKPEPHFIGHCPEVYEMGQTNGVTKNEDDFSEILAGVRKTCFSN